LGALQQRIDQCRRRPMGSGAEDGRLRQLRDELFDGRLRLKARVAICAHQVRERLRDTLPWLAVGHDCRKFHLRVACDEAQQLACHVPRATEHDGWNGLAHCGAFTPNASITRSPRAAPSVIALKAGTPSCRVMMSTPT